MKTVYIHVGLEKTGTTAIQGMLNEKKQYIVEKYNLSLESMGHNLTMFHHSIGKKFIPSTVGPVHLPIEDELLQRYLESFQKSSYSRLVISSELFSYSSEEDISKLAEVLKGFDVKIVCFFRPQDQYFMSQYLQSLKGVWKNGRRPVSIDIFNTHNLDYNEFCLKWEKHFGEENILAQIYGDKSHKTIFDHFFSIITEGEHKAGDIEFDKKIVNPGLSAVHQHIIAEDIASLDSQDLRVLVEQSVIAHSNLYQVNMKKGERHTILSKAQSKAILDEYSKSNLEFSKRKLGLEKNIFKTTTLPDKKSNLHDFRNVYVGVINDLFNSTRENKGINTKYPTLFIGGTGRSGTTTLIRSLSRLDEFSSFDGIELKMFSAPGGFVQLQNNIVDHYNYGRATNAFKATERSWAKLCGGKEYGQKALADYIPQSELDQIFEKFTKQLIANNIIEPISKDVYIKAVSTLLSQLQAKVCNDDTAYFIEKTPHNLLDLKFLKEISNNSKYIHILRDPLLTAISVSSQSWGPTSLDTCLNYVEAYFKRWEVVKRWALDNDVELLDMSVEGILTDIDATSDKIAKLLGLDISATLKESLSEFSKDRQIQTYEKHKDEREFLYNLASPRIKGWADASYEMVHS